MSAPKYRPVNNDIAGILRRMQPRCQLTTVVVHAGFEGGLGGEVAVVVGEAVAAGLRVGNVAHRAAVARAASRRQRGVAAGELSGVTAAGVCAHVSVEAPLGTHVVVEQLLGRARRHACDPARLSRGTEKCGDMQRLRADEPFTAL